VADVEGRVSKDQVGEGGGYAVEQFDTFAAYDIVIEVFHWGMIPGWAIIARGFLSLWGLIIA
ncbi:MAG: hypothetical protein KAS23_07285, partial [Anaerohalosphaera sp.]|nr:hypothetical protein [Anaerohalosphaera sp.]